MERRNRGDADHVAPEVTGTLFRVAALPVGSSGTQTVVAAIRDAAGNMGYATNHFVADVCTNGVYSYDAAGNVTNIEYRGTATTESRAFVWNARGELLSATFGAETESYQYDALGRRAAIVSNSAATSLIYEGPHVAQERDAGGVDTRSYDYGPGVDWLLGFGAFSNGVLCGYFRCITDVQGTVHAIVDESGGIVERYEFDAWGRVLGVYDGSGVPLQRTACGNRYLFQGREYSWVSGLYYFRARWYDPVTGRWMSKDPIGIDGGMNQYVFCGDSPLRFRDPFGLCDQPGRPWCRNLLPDGQYMTGLVNLGMIFEASFGMSIYKNDAEGKIGIYGVEGLSLGWQGPAIQGSYGFVHHAPTLDDYSGGSLQFDLSGGPFGQFGGEVAHGQTSGVTLFRDTPPSRGDLALSPDGAITYGATVGLNALPGINAAVSSLTYHKAPLPSWAERALWLAYRLRPSF